MPRAHCAPNRLRPPGAAARRLCLQALLGLALIVLWAGEAACAEVQAAAPTGGPGNDVTMGNQLATGETINALNFNSYFSISENLTLGLETGYAHFAGYKTSTWGPQFTHRVQDAFKASLGFTFTY